MTTKNATHDHLTARRSAIIAAIAREIFGLQRFVPEDVRDLESYVIEFLAYQVNRGDFDHVPNSELPERLADAIDAGREEGDLALDSIVPLYGERSLVFEHVKMHHAHCVCDYLESIYGPNIFDGCQSITDAEARVSYAALELDLLAFAERLRESKEFENIPEL
jgi:hypothetical protein